jgi:hypothetical protein
MNTLPTDPFVYDDPGLREAGRGEVLLNALVVMPPEKASFAVRAHLTVDDLRDIAHAALLDRYVPGWQVTACPPDLAPEAVPPPVPVRTVHMARDEVLSLGRCGATNARGGQCNFPVLPRDIVAECAHGGTLHREYADRAEQRRCLFHVDLTTAPLRVVIE